jgi:membrane associated rhomboid family serine protease
MTPSVNDPLEAILRLCAATAPKPWYPKQYAAEAGVSRDALDAPLERLRLAGFVQLTEWVEGNGQGYALTPAGRRALQNPRELDRLNANRAVLPDAAPPRPARPREGDMTTYERGELVRETLLTPTTPVMTRILLAANIAVFLYGLFLAQRVQLPTDVYLHLNPIGGVPAAHAEKFNQVLASQGAVSGLEYGTGLGWWARLVASYFVHIGLTHLFMNMLFLYRAGPFIERMWGSWRFLVIYMLAGLGGSCMAMGLSPIDSQGRLTLLAGASGALCGIFAAEAAWLLLNRRYLPPNIVRSWVGTLMQNTFLIVVISVLPGVSGLGHLGGAIVGFVSAVLVHYQRFGRGIMRLLAMGAVALVPILCLAGLSAAISLNPRWTELRRLTQARHPGTPRDHFGERFVEPASKAHDAASKALKEALQGQTLEGRLKERDPKQMSQAADALAAAQRELLAVAASLAAVSFEDPAEEENRSVLEQLMRKRAELCALTELYIRENRLFMPGTEERTTWEQLRRESDALLQRWKDLP